MAEGIEEAPKAVGNALTHKLGPLPVWGWALLIVGAGGVIYLVFLRGGGSSAPTPSGVLGGGTPPTGGLGGGAGGGGGGGTPSPPTPPTTPLTNWQWLTNISSQVAQATGLPLAQVQLYLNEYLNGEGPTGSTTATSLWQKVVDSALGLGGQPPAPVSQPSSSNYFGSNQNWLTSILEFLPSGTPGSVQTELTNLVNGTTVSISQAAADALKSAEGIVGAAPQALSYQIANPTPTPQPYVAVTGDQIHNALSALSQSVPNWWQGTSSQVEQYWSSALKPLFPTLTANQWQSLYQGTVSNPTFLTNGQVDYNKVATYLNQVASGA